MDSINPDLSGRPRPRRPRGDRVKRLALLAAAALGAGAACVGVAAIADAGSTASKTTTTTAAGRHGSFFGARPGTFGTVKSVGSGRFTLTTPENTIVTVDVTSATKYQDPGKSSASLADVTVGQHVAVAGTDTSSNTVAATDVFIGGHGPHGGFRGPGGWAG
jgi:hypothetical protein